MIKRYGFLLLMLGFAFPAQALQVKEIQAGGVSALMVEDRHVPVMELILQFEGAGRSADPQDGQGRALLLADMLMQGAGDKDALAFQQALEEGAIQLSASAGLDNFTIQLKTLIAHRKEAIELLKAALTHPQFSDERLADSKQAMLAAIRQSGESVQYQAGLQFSRMIYGDHPYGKASLGEAEAIAALTADDLEQARAQTLAKGNLFAAIVGAVNQEEAEAILADITEDLPDSPQNLPEISKITLTPPADAATQISRQPMDIPQSVVWFGTQGVSRNDPDFYALYVLNHIVGGGGLTSELAAAVREQRGLAYSIGTDLDMNDYSSLWLGSFATRREAVEEALEATKETLARLAKDGVTGEQLANAKSYIMGSFPLSLDSNAAIAGYLISIQRYQLGLDYFDKRNGYFAAVTLADVNRLAAQLLDPSKHYISVTGGVDDAAAPAAPEPQAE